MIDYLYAPDLGVYFPTDMVDNPVLANVEFIFARTIKARALTAAVGDLVDGDPVVAVKIRGGIWRNVTVATVGGARRKITGWDEMHAVTFKPFRCSATD